MPSGILAHRYVSDGQARSFQSFVKPDTLGLTFFPRGISKTATRVTVGGARRRREPVQNRREERKTLF
jgi:hypothetical protein